MMPFRDVPIFVNSFNRLACLRQLLEWLRAAGHRRIFVVDNASTYLPLLDYLDEVERHHIATVIRSPPDNVGHLAIWACGLLDRLGITGEYVYTDPDVVPADFCPSDLVGFLQAVVDENPEILAAGPGLRLDDIPDHYPHRARGAGLGEPVLAEAGGPGLVPRRDRHDLRPLPAEGRPQRRRTFDTHGLAVSRRARELVQRPSASHGRGLSLLGLGPGRHFPLVGV